MEGAMEIVETQIQTTMQSKKRTINMISRIMKVRGEIMKFLYIITDSTGRKSIVVATQRQIAIKSYCKATGMPEDFFKKYCKIKNNGRIGKSV